MRVLVAGLHLRASMLDEGSIRRLGVATERARVLARIQTTFSSSPLVGRPLGCAVLDDKKAFREVPNSELDEAFASAEKLDWQDVPDSEVEQAFEMNSVYIWLDGTSWPFYVPCFLSYALQHPGSQCEFFRS